MDHNEENKYCKISCFNPFSFSKKKDKKKQDDDSKK